MSKLSAFKIKKKTNPWSFLTAILALDSWVRNRIRNWLSGVRPPSSVCTAWDSAKNRLCAYRPLCVGGYSFQMHSYTLSCCVLSSTSSDLSSTDISHTPNSQYFRDFGTRLYRGKDFAWFWDLTIRLRVEPADAIPDSLLVMRSLSR